MDKFQEIVDLSQAEGFEITGAFVDDLVNAHNEYVAGVAGEAEIYNSRVLELEAALNERDSIISQLKAQNADMLLNMPAADSDDSDDSEDNSDIDVSDVDIDDLFE